MIEKLPEEKNVSFRKNDQLELSGLDFGKESSFDIHTSGNSNELSHYCLVRLDKYGNIVKILTDSEAEEVLTTSDEMVEDDRRANHMESKPSVNNKTIVGSHRQDPHQYNVKGRPQKKTLVTQNSHSHARTPPRNVSQYKPGGPCDHCGVTESPQWRKGPASKPQLCNACGTRYRRTSKLDRQSPTRPSVLNVGKGKCRNGQPSKSPTLTTKKRPLESSHTGKQQFAKRSKQKYEDNCVKQRLHSLPIISSLTTSPAITSISISRAAAVKC